MKKIFNYLLSLVLALLFFGCGSTHKSLIYNEPSIDLKKLDIRRIAIVPNRLPLNLTDPEKWRRYNWEIANHYLQANGFEVVDYYTSVAAFNKSGLPLEDTKSSRDKYADLAQELSVDAILIPYYGTQASMASSFFISKMNWTAVATFQIYSAEMNDFITRLDMTGIQSYTSGILTLLGFGLMYVDPSVGGLTFLGGSLFDMFFTVFRSQESHFKEAFKLAITKGLDPFIYTYGKETRYSQNYRSIPEKRNDIYEPKYERKREIMNKNNREGSKLGIIVGPNWYKPKFRNKFSFGYQFGFFYKSFLSDFVNLRTEILYRRSSYNESTVWTDPYGYELGIYYIKYKGNYMDLNLLFNYQLNNKFSFTIGPMISYFINAKYETRLGSTTIKSDDNPLFGLNLGASYQLSKINFNVRYFLDFGNDFSDVYSQNIILLLGFEF